jgi:hypothetical protein
MLERTSPTLTHDIGKELYYPHFAKVLDASLASLTDIGLISSINLMHLFERLHSSGHAT